MTEMKKLDANESKQRENKQPKDSEQSQVTEPKWPASVGDETSDLWRRWNAEGWSGGGWVSTGQLDIFRQASLNLEQISEVYWRRELWADRRQRPTIKIQPLKWFSNSPVLSANIFVKNNCFE